MQPGGTCGLDPGPPPLVTGPYTRKMSFKTGVHPHIVGAIYKDVSTPTPSPSPHPQKGYPGGGVNIEISFGNHFLFPK